MNDSNSIKAKQTPLEPQPWLPDTILDQLSDAVIAIDNQQKVIYLNKAAAQRYEVSAGQAIGLPLGELHTWRWLRPQDEALAYSSLEEHGKWHGETTHFTRSGRKMLVESTLTELRDERGLKIGLLETVRDIDGHEQADQAAVREGEQRFRQLADAMPQIVWTANAAGAVDYLNSWVSKLDTLQFNADGTWNWQSIVHPEDLERTTRAWQTATSAGQAYKCEHRARMADGSYRWHLSRGVPVHDESGMVLGWFGTDTDVHDLKLAQEALRKSEERVRNFADTAPAMLWVTEADASCSFLSRGWFEYTGQKEEALGFGWIEAVHPDERAASLDNLLSANENREPFTLECRLCRSNGVYRWAMITGRPRFGAAGEFLGYVGSFIDIHDRKRAEEALRESEARFRIMADGLPLIVWVHDAQGRQEFVNRTFLEYFGVSEDEMRDERWRLLIHPDDAENYAREFLACNKERRPFHAETRVRRADGQWRWLESWGRPRFSLSGGFLGFVGASADVTERKRAEVALRRAGESDAFRVSLSDALRSLSNPDKIQAVAARVLGTHLHASRVYYEVADDGGEYRLIQEDYCDSVPSLTGRHRFDSYGQWVMDELCAGRKLVVADVAADPRLSPDDKTAYAALQIRACVMVPLMQDGAPEAMMAVHQPQPRAWTEQEIELIEETAERTRAAAGQARTAAALRESELRFRVQHQRTVEILESISDAFYAVDANFCFTYVNRKAEQLWMRRRNELLQKEIWSEFPQSVGSELYTMHQKVMSERKPVQFETVSPSSGRWVDVSIFPEAGGGLSCYFRDITERKQAEKALREADRRKDDFLATLAHELRNPLAPIRNAVQILKLQSQPDPTLQSAHKMIDRQLHHMVRLIDDLLDVSRITRGKLQLRQERVDLGTVLQHAVEISQPHIQQEGHELTVSLPPRPIYLQADPVRLAQVFQNLLNNACKYTEKHGRITLTAALEGTEAVVKVADTGIGISPENLYRVFEMFEQVGSRVEQTQCGLGIGLSLARGLVAMHSGNIEAKSEGQGKGSEFIVRLPAMAQSSPEQPACPESGDDPHTKAGRRILVVDDNRDIVDSLALLLRLRGSDVRTARDGMEAVEAAEKFLPQVVLLDIGMPRLDGFATCRRLREQPWGKNLVIIALTGWGQEDDRAKSKQAGFDDHLVKPVEPAALLRLLEELDKS